MTWAFVVVFAGFATVWNTYRVRLGP